MSNPSRCIINVQNYVKWDKNELPQFSGCRPGVQYTILRTLRVTNFEADDDGNKTKCSDADDDDNACVLKFS